MSKLKPKKPLQRELTAREAHWLKDDPQAAELFRQAVTSVAFHLTLTKTQITSLKLQAAEEEVWRQTKAKRYFLPSATVGLYDISPARRAGFAIKDTVSPHRALLSKGLIAVNPLRIRWDKDKTPAERRKYEQQDKEGVPHTLLTRQGRLVLELIQMAGL